MKKLVTLIVCLGVLFFWMTGNVNATPFTDSLPINQWLNGTGTYSWVHDTPSGFEVPYDIVNSGSLTIYAFNPAENSTIVAEGITIGALTPGAGFTTTSLDIGTVFVSWLAGGDLDVTLNYNQDSSPLWLIGSQFDLNYTNGSPPADTPEPSTILLIGGGLFGIIAMRRKLKR